MTRLVRLAFLLLSALAPTSLLAQQFSYYVVGPTTVAPQSVIDVTVSITFNSPPAPAAGFATSWSLYPSFDYASLSPQVVNARANCNVVGAISYTTTTNGAESPGQPIDLCQYRVRAAETTIGGVQLFSSVSGPLITVQESSQAPGLIFSPATGSPIDYPSSGLGPQIEVGNDGTGAGSGAASTTTLTACIIVGGDLAFQTTSFNPAIAAIGNTSPSPAAIRLPNCVPGLAPVTATLRCSETRAGQPPVQRAWTLNCPAIAAGEGPPVSPPVVESVALDGGLPNRDSLQPELSGDGNMLAFASDATNLVAGDTNNRRDVFLRDRVRAVTTRISAGVQTLDPAAQDFANPSISQSGALIAFEGSSGQLYAQVNGTPRRISAAAEGIPGNGPSRNPDVAGNGPWIYFESEATNLLPEADPTGPLADIYRKNADTGAVQRVASNVGAASTSPVASADGSLMVYVNRPGSGQPQCMAIRNAGFGQSSFTISRVPPDGSVGNGECLAPLDLTPDGRYAVFASRASNLVTGDTNGVADIFRAEIDRSSNRVLALVRVSEGPGGVQANRASSEPKISGNGLAITFKTEATNLFAGDTNGTADTVVKRMDTGEIAPLTSGAGILPNGPSDEPTISCDGRKVAYGSQASNIVGNDSNGAKDIYSSTLNPVTANDEPNIGCLTLPTPTPPNANCPAGFFTTTITDGPGPGLVPGIFGVELLLDEPGTRVLAGGLNFGGLIDAGQPGFAGITFTNPALEPQRITMRLTGSPSSSSSGSLPIRLLVERTTPAGREAVFSAVRSISLGAEYLASIDLTPGFYVASVALDGASSSQIGGPAEGQFFLGMTTSFIGRPGGGFQGGAVVGGYHAAHPFGGVSGFAAFCLATQHNASVRVLSRPTYGETGARDLRLRVLDTAQNTLVAAPGGSGTGGNGGQLLNGVALVGSTQSTSINSDFNEYTVVIPGGSSNFNVSISNNTGDLDLFVRRGAPPSLTVYDCVSGSPSGNESCTIAAPAAGTYFVRVYGYSTGRHAYTIRATWNAP